MSIRVPCRHTKWNQIEFKERPKEGYWITSKSNATNIRPKTLTIKAKTLLQDLKLFRIQQFETHKLIQTAFWSLKLSFLVITPLPIFLPSLDGDIRSSYILKKEIRIRWSDIKLGANFNRIMYMIPIGAFFLHLYQPDCLLH